MAVYSHKAGDVMNTLDVRRVVSVTQMFKSIQGAADDVAALGELKKFAKFFRASDLFNSTFHAVEFLAGVDVQMLRTDPDVLVGVVDAGLNLEDILAARVWALSFAR